MYQPDFMTVHILGVPLSPAVAINQDKENIDRPFCLGKYLSFKFMYLTMFTFPKIREKKKYLHNTAVFSFKHNILIFPFEMTSGFK